MHNKTYVQSICQASFLDDCSTSVVVAGCDAIHDIAHVDLASQELLPEGVEHQGVLTAWQRFSPGQVTSLDLHPAVSKLGVHLLDEGVECRAGTNCAVETNI